MANIEPETLTMAEIERIIQFLDLPPEKCQGGQAVLCICDEMVAIGSEDAFFLAKEEDDEYHLLPGDGELDRGSLRGFLNEVVTNSNEGHPTTIYFIITRIDPMSIGKSPNNERLFKIVETWKYPKSNVLMPADENLTLPHPELKSFGFEKNVPNNQQPQPHSIPAMTNPTTKENMDTSTASLENPITSNVMPTTTVHPAPTSLTMDAPVMHPTGNIPPTMMNANGAIPAPYIHQLHGGVHASHPGQTPVFPQTLPQTNLHQNSGHVSINNNMQGQQQSMGNVNGGGGGPIPSTHHEHHAQQPQPNMTTNAIHQPQYRPPPAGAHAIPNGIGSPLPQGMPGAPPPMMGVPVNGGSSSPNHPNNGKAPNTIQVFGAKVKKSNLVLILGGAIVAAAAVYYFYNKKKKKREMEIAMLDHNQHQRYDNSYNDGSVLESSSNSKTSRSKKKTNKKPINQ